MVKVPQGCHATKRSSQPVGGEGRQLHVVQVHNKRVTAGANHPKSRRGLAPPSPCQTSARSP